MTKQDDPPAHGATKRQRIAKAMARAGLCSRRDAEGWIVGGRVNVNGTVLTSPALDVGPQDTILVDGVPLPTTEKTRLFLFHKPRGLVTSDHDPEGRATVTDFLRENWPEGPRVVTVGRLDINTEGLLLLTNDGGLARVLELPRTGWLRRYRVRAKGEANPASLEALATGATIDGVDYAGIEAQLDRVQGANCWLTLGLREGKNREVKRVLEHIGLEVNRLIRLSFGPFQLLDLPEGAVEEVRTRVLRDQLGETLAKQAGVAFESAEPVETPRRDRSPAHAERIERSGAGRATPRPQRPHATGAGRDTARSRSPKGARDQRGGSPTDAPPPKRERPLAGSRKHVSTLRANDAKTARTGPRKRIEREETRDRHDRAVKVERLSPTRPAPTRSSPERPRPRTAGIAGKSEPRDRDATRPRSNNDRPDKSEGSTRRGNRPGPRHASPSALGKRERKSRSGVQSPRQDRRPDADNRGATSKPRHRDRREDRRPGAARILRGNGSRSNASPRSDDSPRSAGGRPPRGPHSGGKPPRGPSKHKR